MIFGKPLCRITFGNLTCLGVKRDFLGGSDGKASAYNAADPGSIPGSGRSSWRRKWQSTPVLFPGKSHGQRSLVGYSPWGRKESDTTEQLHFIITSLLPKAQGVILFPNFFFNI